MADALNHLLLLDTCGAEASLALAQLGPEARILATRTLPGRRASEILLSAISELLAAQAVALGALAAIVVVTGPGSFTGIRVGLSAAKGLSEALGTPVIAISRLAVLAGSAPGREVIALLDAGRGEFYCGFYRPEQPAAERLLSREGVASLAAAYPEATLVACEPALVSARSGLELVIVPDLTAADAFALALARLRERDFADVVLLDGNYVRNTDAEIFAKPVRSGPAPV